MPIDSHLPQADPFSLVPTFTWQYPMDHLGNWVAAFFNKSKLAGHFLALICLPFFTVLQYSCMPSLPSLPLSDSSRSQRVHKIVGFCHGVCLMSYLKRDSIGWDGFFAHCILSRIERKDLKSFSCYANIYWVRARFNWFSAKGEYTEGNFSVIARIKF